MVRRKKLKPFVVATVVLMVALNWLLGGGAPEGECLIKRVSDGDTVTLDCNGEKVRVRMYCIDAPETKQKPWGSSSRAHLQELAGQTVKLRRLDTDRYQRVVGEIWRNELNLNLQQVRDGMAAVYPQYCSDSKYFEAEKNAQRNKSGIWKKKGLHQTPWVWRNQRRS